MSANRFWITWRCAVSTHASADRGAASSVAMSCVNLCGVMAVLGWTKPLDTACPTAFLETVLRGLNAAGSGTYSGGIRSAGTE